MGTRSNRRAGLAGYAGSADFDPFGFAAKIDIRWLREAEVKHGRVSMLAVLGYTLPELCGMKFPFVRDDLWHANPIKAVQAMPEGVWTAFILSVGFIDYAAHEGKIDYYEMYGESSDREPGVTLHELIRT